MKKFTKMLFAALLSMTVSASYAQFTADTELTVAPGSTGSITFYQTTPAGSPGYGWVGYEAVVKLPEGITITGVKPVAEGWNDGGAGMDMSYTASSNKLVIAPVTAASEIVAGENVAVFTVEIAVDASVAEGTALTIETSEWVVFNNDFVQDEVADFNIIVTAQSTTGINEVSTEKANAPVYNLAGVRMNGNLQKGMYIQNGKKFIVK